MVQGRNLNAELLSRLQNKNQIDPGSANNTNHPSVEDIEIIEVSFKIGAKEVKQNLKYKMGGNFYARVDADYGDSYDRVGDFRVMW